MLCRHTEVSAMHRKALFVVLTCSALFLKGRIGAAQAPEARFGDAEAAFGMPQIDLRTAAAQDIHLPGVLSELERQGVHPAGTRALVHPDSPGVYVVPLSAEAS